MEKQQALFVNPHRVSSTGVVSDQPEISHRTLTEAEASAIWQVFRSASLPNDLKELRIVLRPEDKKRARGWVVQVGPSGPSLPSPVSAGPIRK